MAKETFPPEQSGLVPVPQERILLPQVEVAEVDWPVRTTRFNRKSGILIVDVDEPGLISKLVDEPVLSELVQQGFRPKQGLHMTVAGYENGNQILGALKSMPPERQMEMLQTVEEMAEAIDWSWRPAGGLHSFRGQRRKSLKVISRVECPGFGTFYEGLSQLMPAAEFKLYPPHITLLKRPGEVSHRVPSRIGGVVLSQPLLSLNYPTIE